MTETGEMASCGRCGAATDPATSARSSEGLVCASCEENEAQGELWRSASKQLLGSAFGSLGFSAVSWIIDPCMLFTLLAVAGALTACASLFRNREYSEQLGWRMPLAGVAAVLALVLVGLKVLVVGASLALG